MKNFIQKILKIIGIIKLIMVAFVLMVIIVFIAVVVLFMYGKKVEKSKEVLQVMPPSKSMESKPKEKFVCGSGPCFQLIGDSLTLNGKAMPFGASLTEWTKILGKPSRKLDRSGGMVVWDSLGIAAEMLFNHPVNDQHIRRLWLVFTHSQGDFWPKQLFTGKINITQIKTRNGEATCEFHHGIRQKEIEANGFDKYWDNENVAFRLSGNPVKGYLENDSLEVFFIKGFRHITPQ